MNRGVLKIAVLYSELADYSIACLRELANTEETKVLLIHWPINAEAPFSFDLSFCDKSIIRDQITDSQLIAKVSKFNPDKILCSGWVDKGYLKVCRELKRSTITILAMDNHWRGSLKQQVAALLAHYTIKPYFDHAFVPGTPQTLFARKLGFNPSQITSGFYTADTLKFNQKNQEGEKYTGVKKIKRFLFLGRYVSHKGIFDLWDAFSKFRVDHPNWELWCVGTGEEFENRVESEGIKHFGFVQPDDLFPILEECNVYILPSHFEPWGVSVHEMAAAGFPMLLSDKIGSKEVFLKEGENGLVFKAGNSTSLLDAMCSMADKSEIQLKEMSAISNDLGMSVTPKKWVDSLLSITST